MPADVAAVAWRYAAASDTAGAVASGATARGQDLGADRPPWLWEAEDVISTVCLLGTPEVHTMDFLQVTPQGMNSIRMRRVAWPFDVAKNFDSPPSAHTSHAKTVAHLLRPRDIREVAPPVHGGAGVSAQLCGAVMGHGHIFSGVSREVITHHRAKVLVVLWYGLCKHLAGTEVLVWAKDMEFVTVLPAHAKI